MLSTATNPNLSSLPHHWYTIPFVARQHHILILTSRLRPLNKGRVSYCCDIYSYDAIMPEGGFFPKWAMFGHFPLPCRKWYIFHCICPNLTFFFTPVAFTSSLITNLINIIQSHDHGGPPNSPMSTTRTQPILRLHRWVAALSLAIILGRK